MLCGMCIVMALAAIIDPSVCLPIAQEITVTEQDHSSTEELEIVSVEHYEPQNAPVAMNKKKLPIPPEDPTTKVPSTYNNYMLKVSIPQSSDDIIALTTDT